MIHIVADVSVLELALVVVLGCLVAYSVGVIVVKVLEFLDSCDPKDRL